MRVKAPEWSPYRFGFDNPLRYKDADGNWEEDGHFWTVLAYGLAKGLNYETAFVLAKGAESLDHKVHSNYKMVQTDGKSTFARVFGFGTWADGGCNHMSGGTQQFGHALTGEEQSISNQFATEQLLTGNLVALHTLGDSWAHSYVNEDGVRMNYGASTGFTTQHASVIKGANLTYGLNVVDNIHERKDAYDGYLKSLDNAISSLYKLEIGFDSSIHDYVQQNGVTKENNILLFKNYAEWKGKYIKSTMYNSSEFTLANQKQMKLWTGYLDKINVSYKVIATTHETKKRGRSHTYKTYEVIINDKPEGNEDKKTENKGG
ncbi:hypothetical protein NHF50_00060 [Flavobacterium sp. NRK F10]|nr:hypothetical protein [Flavobacterium sp. NRK F10]